MSNEYSLVRTNKKVSKHAVMSVAIGVFCFIGYLLLIVASILSIGTLGVVGGFFGCLFLLLSIFGALWGVFSYDEAKTTKKYKKAGIIINILGVIWGLLLFAL